MSIDTFLFLKIAKLSLYKEAIKNIYQKCMENVL